jgi:hypothetical protein
LSITTARQPSMTLSLEWSLRNIGHGSK